VLSELRPGSVFAGYRILRRLGTGGAGAVYLVAHPRLPRHDALKVLSPEHSADDEYRARFVREAELAGRLDHPNIVAVHDRGVTNGQLWIAMRFVDGTGAGALLRAGGAMPPERAVHVITDAARGLDEAHRLGLVHRDVKPANLLVEIMPGRPDRVLVADFGIARAAEFETLSDVGAVVATLAYAAPEQLMAQPVDQRADVYGLGCTFYELLTGAKPFPRPTAAAVMRAQLEDPPPRATASNPALPQGIDAVIARAMAKDPGLRYESCGALAAAAALALAGHHVPEPVPVRRRWIRPAVAAVLVAAVVLAAVAVGAWLGGSSPGPSVSNPATVTASTSVTVTTAVTTTAVSGTTAAAPTWGAYDNMVRRFPALLATSPTTAGYEGLRCMAVTADGQPASVNADLPDPARLRCTGDHNPVDTLGVICAGVTTTIAAVPGPPVVGTERWQRPSGTGSIQWGQLTGPNGPTGTLQISFDDTVRNSCVLTVTGGSSGRDLMNRWWTGAPI
jgi:serine/threonine-protein kinase